MQFYLKKIRQTEYIIFTVLFKIISFLNFVTKFIYRYLKNLNKLLCQHKQYWAKSDMKTN